MLTTRRALGAPLQDLGGRDARGWRYIMTDGSATDYDVDFRGRADNTVHGGAIAEGRCMYSDL